MKRIALALLLLVATATFTTSCDSYDSIDLNQDDIYMYAGQTYELRVDGIFAGRDLTWISENSDIAEVNMNGVVLAKQVGVTQILVQVGGEILNCDVEVRPRLQLYVEPILLFGMTLNDVKANEYRTLYGESFDRLTYSDGTINIDYFFDRSRLVESCAILNPRLNIDNVFDFLDERYAYVGDVQNYYVWKGRGVFVTVSSDRNGIYVSYRSTYNVTRGVKAAPYIDMNSKGDKAKRAESVTKLQE